MDKPDTFTEWAKSWIKNIETPLLKRCAGKICSPKGIIITSGLLLILLVFTFIDSDKARNIALTFAAIFGFPLFIWRGVTQDRSSRATKEQAKAALENAKTTSKSQLADAYTRAIEQLGAKNKGKDMEEPNLELRLGGIYALEKIAQGSKDYHPQIMEFLCSYVRLHTSKENKAPGGQTKPLKSPRIDIQTCLTVIGRRNTNYDNKDVPLNLSHIDIKAVKLKEAKLQRVNFFGADLTCADLRGANLQGAKLFGVKLRGVQFEETSLQGMDLRGATLENANLREANLQEANLENVELTGARLQGTNLKGANLRRANLGSYDGAVDQRSPGVKGLTADQLNSAIIDGETRPPEYLEIIQQKDGSFVCKDNNS